MQWSLRKSIEEAKNAALHEKGLLEEIKSLKSQLAAKDKERVETVEALHNMESRCISVGAKLETKTKGRGGNFDALSGRCGGAHVSASESTRESVRCNFENLATFLSWRNGSTMSVTVLVVLGLQMDFLANKRLKMETMSETKLYNASRSTNLVLVISSYDFVSIV